MPIALQTQQSSALPEELSHRSSARLCGQRVSAQRCVASWLQAGLTMSTQRTGSRDVKQPSSITAARLGTTCV
eukprot:15457822-Alexandrium_andersonii.AAC.1